MRAPTRRRARSSAAFPQAAADAGTWRLVLHYDHDYDVIRAHTPLSFRSVWVAERGSVA